MVEISAILAVFQACSWSDTFGPATCLLAKPPPKKTASACRRHAVHVCEPKPIHRVETAWTLTGIIEYSAQTVILDAGYCVFQALLLETAH